ncbi:MAG TPA: UV DNA damage repair endonuclease UvsE, partial [Thermoanaerobaculia bacterium]|nr:UV DNA damage repair endonuclease UvsE [Thermoanaerobaculia bacterium]
KPHLGLVCLTTTDEVRFRTITRTRLRSLATELQPQTLRELYADNVRRLSNAIDFCARRKIHLYRLTSGLFPQSEEPPGFDIVSELAPELGRIGRRATELGIRLVMHPDQFVVLSSDNPQVVENSITILRHHARVLDLLEQPRSAWAAVEIHGGKGNRASALVERIPGLPDEIRSRLVLENDEYAYSASEILDVCRGAGVPMVFDAHHHVVHEKLDSYDDGSIAVMVAAARETWPDPSWQMVHISNGKSGFNDPDHADYIDRMPPAFRDVFWIEVEAKKKELAIDQLRRRWK